MSICEERVLKYGQPGTKAILKIQKLKLKTKAKLLIVSWNQSRHVAKVHVTTVRPFFANTACCVQPGCQVCKDLSLSNWVCKIFFNS